jgi:hypothetical protein
MTKKYINDPGYEVPENKIIVIPTAIGSDGNYKEVIQSLIGDPKRNWFNSHFYYCLPLIIGNQQGFVIKSTRDFDIYWDDSFNYHGDVTITYLDNDLENKQHFASQFGSGILTIQNDFALKTQPGVSIMTIQPPNMYIPGCVAMTGVIETDQIRRDFTFNLKITIPNIKISIKKGDPLGAFIPVKRKFIDNFEIGLVSDFFEESFHLNEIEESQTLGRERLGIDKTKPHESGRRYFNGIHSDGTIYPDHQKRIK